MALSAYLGLLALVGLERAGELLLSRRNARIALARGGVESAADHFRWMTALHALFLPACALEAWGRQARPAAASWGHDWTAASWGHDWRAASWGHDWIVSPQMDWSYVALAFVLFAQALRWWAIASLGWRWNVRVIVTPGEPPSRRGPYRWVRHPNYIAVIVEFLAIPLVQGAWLTALLFSLLNAAVLRIRIRDEERALGEEYQRAFAQVPRFIPHG